MEVKELNEIRKERGLQIANTSRIMRRERGGYIVPSQSGSGAYVVQYDNATFKPKCECEDFEKRSVMGIKCKHIWAVELTINKKLNEDGSTTVTKAVKVTYPQNWTAYNFSQIHQKELFQKLLNDLCRTIPNPTQSLGRPTLPLSDMIFSSALKVFSTFSLRRFVADMTEAKEMGYIDKVCSYSTVSNYMRNPELTEILVGLILKSAVPLKNIETDFSIDSSGFGTSRFDRWFSFKYGKEMLSRVWVKAHIMNGNKTHIVTGVKITEAYSHDSKEFSELVNMTARTFDIKEVCGDKAYSSRNNLDLINEIGAKPYIPFKDNAIEKSRGSMFWKKMYHYFMFNREEFLQHYHNRSNSETVFHMIKSKFGDYVRSNDWTAQINEVLLKILCHNICCVIQEMNELGISPDFCLKSD